MVRSQAQDKKRRYGDERNRPNFALQSRSFFHVKSVDLPESLSTRIAGPKKQGPRFTSPKSAAPPPAGAPEFHRNTGAAFCGFPPASPPGLSWFRGSPLGLFGARRVWPARESLPLLPIV